ncbi:ornithine cyclodeaminase [Sinobaca sp. H24]|uniref:ornithine cyclodeaminase n=1 Tax=Sinobaca sp. H24 TaxID=2923376 RepID=UPI00207A5CC4|nr:ornithine cyclodeaminase [Sinobaca sp. H24]
MGLISSIKKILTRGETASNSDVLKENTMPNQVKKQNSYINIIKKSKYQKIKTHTLIIKDEPSWESFFSSTKENLKFIGFHRRSRRKFRHLYHNEKLIVVEADKTIEVVKEDSIQKLSYKDTPIEKFRAETANAHGVILRHKNEVTMINITTGLAFQFEFDWQPLTLAMGEDFWLVGTRDTYNGPGELYCFDYEGNQKWAIIFTEEFQSFYGDLTFMPYLLDVSVDSSDIFVGSMDRLYRLDVEGKLCARIAVSDLKKKDLEEKYQPLNRSLSQEPKSKEEAIHIIAERMASQFSLGIENSMVNSPFLGFGHDPKTDMIFLLEEKGRVSAWDKNGQLKWINSFKKEGTYIGWIDRKVVCSFETGETFWVDKEGHFLYGVKLPKQAKSISLIPDKEAYLIVCEDQRLYELDKETGKLIKGTDGHPGMELFQIENHNIFFDGEHTSQGYFWLAPEGKEWEHFEAKTIKDTDETNIESGVAPEIAATQPFSVRNEFNAGKRRIINRIIDAENERMYLVEKPETNVGMNIDMTESQWRKDRLNHYLKCCNFDGKEIWSLQIYSDMWSLYASPDKKTIFTSAPTNEEITYKPGHFYVISSDGRVLKKIMVKAHGFHIEFISERKGVILFASETSGGDVGILEQDEKENWSLTLVESTFKEIVKPYGMGMNHFHSEKYKLERTDKKKYKIRSIEKEDELTFNAAAYEAQETVSGEFAIRIGTRLIALYSQSLEKKLELIEAENVQTFSFGLKSVAIVLKNQIRGYDRKGNLQWRYSSLPKSIHFQIAWFPKEELYVWEVSNNQERMLISITEKGEIIKSESFDSREYYRTPLLVPEENAFIVQSNDTIKVLNPS